MTENTNNSNLPEHCKVCWKITEGDGCAQAVNMHADTEPVDPYYAPQDAVLYCEDCAPTNATRVAPSETDSPDHCDACGIPLKCTLTSDGIAYVTSVLEKGDGCCRELWPELFADTLDLDDPEDEDTEPDYSKMTNEDFHTILENIVNEEGANILSIGSVYNELAEHFNNEILERWAAQQ